MYNWLRKKAVQRSESNIRNSVQQLVDIASQADAYIERTSQFNPFEIKKVKKLQIRLIKQLGGPVPLERVKREIINPLLEQQDISPGVKKTVEHCFNNILRK